MGLETKKQREKMDPSFLTLKCSFNSTDLLRMLIGGCRLSFPEDPLIARTEMPILVDMETTAALVSLVEMTFSSLSSTQFLRMTDQTCFFSTHRTRQEGNCVHACCVIRKLELALTQCRRGLGKKMEKGDADSAPDKAVAFYTGALEGTDGTDNLLHTLADKRCVNFKTCGREGNKLTGTA